MKRFVPRLIASLELIAIFSAAAASAEADPVQVQVLAVQSDDAVGPAQSLTLALKNAAKRQGSLKLVPGDYSLEVLSLALGCPDTPDDACLAKIASKIKSDAFVWGTLQNDGGRLALKLNLYRRGKPKRATEVRYNAGKLDDQALSGIADRALGKLLNAKTHSGSAEVEEETGILLLSADDLNGQVVIDGAPAGDILDGHVQFELPVGEHDISVRIAGYRAAEGTVTVSQSKRALLRLHPEKIGSQHPRHEGSDSDASGNESNASAGWGAIAVGGAFVVAAVYSTVRVNSVNHDADFDSYRAGISKTKDACVEANREVVVTGATSPSRISTLCSQSKTFEALEYVFFGLGAVAAGTGALILLTDDRAPSPKTPKTDGLRAARRHDARLEPSLSVGSHSADFQLQLRF
jgi:hypothetical protein